MTSDAMDTAHCSSRRSSRPGGDRRRNARWRGRSRARRMVAARIAARVAAALVFALVFVAAMAAYLSFVWFALDAFERDGKMRYEAQRTEAYPGSGYWIPACDWNAHPAWEW